MEKIAFSFRPAGDVAALEPLWRDLEARADCRFFLSWDWIGTWLSEIDAKTLLLEGRVGDEIVAMALFCPVAARGIAAGTAHLHETGQADADSLYIEYNGVLVDRRWAGRAERLCIQALMQEGLLRGSNAGWNRIVIGAAAEGMVDALRGSPIPVRVSGEAPTSTVDLAAIRATGKGYLDGLSANTRYQIRRAMRLYEERGPLALETAASVEQAQAYFDEMRVLHQETWTLRGRPGVFSRPFFLRFHRRLIAEGVPRGTVELLRLTAGDWAIGYLYNFLYRGTVYYYASGFAYEADNKAKPGLVSHALCIEHHLARGEDRYDFMAGEARYKESLGTPQPGISTIVLEQSGLRPILANTMRRIRGSLRG
jgi:CelD/BcsL family acetyltransferase involved in cellulose biosynthesis